METIPPITQMIEEHSDEYQAGRFYHYTSLDAFESIMQSMQFRLTRYDLMNRGEDEGNEALRVAADIVRKLHDRGQISGCLSSMLTNALRTDLELFTRYYSSAGMRVPCTPYVICFTQAEPGDNDASDWLTCRDLRLDICLDYGVLDIPREPKFGYSQFNDRDGFCCFRKVDYGKDAIRRRLEGDICYWLERWIVECRSEEFICESIRDLVNEDRMFMHSKEYGFQKETRLVVYVPLDHEAIPGLNEVIKPKRSMNDSGEFVYDSSSDDVDHVYIDLNVPLPALNVDLFLNSDTAKKRVDAAMEGHVKHPSAVVLSRNYRRTQ